MQGILPRGTSPSGTSSSVIALLAASWLCMTAVPAAAQDQGEVLEPGVPTQGTLAEGESLVYAVDGADTVTLTSLAGDADLFVFYDFDASFEEAVCISDATPDRDEGRDVCRLPDDGPYNVVVDAFTDTTYELVATLEGGGPPTEPEFVSLPTGAALEGTLAQDEIAFFVTAPGADDDGDGVGDYPDTLRLTSFAGDADLYVYSDPSFAEESLICAAAAFSEDSTLDECLVSPAAPAYVAVVGFTDVSYGLEATRETELQAPEFIALELGRPVQGTVAEGEFAFYELGGEATVTLSSLAGDADLYVYDDPTLADGSDVCIAAAFSADSTLDVCDLPPGGPYYIGVAGWTDANYEIEAAPRSTAVAPPPEGEEEEVVTAPEEPVQRPDSELLEPQTAPETQPVMTGPERPAPDVPDQLPAPVRPTPAATTPTGTTPVATTPTATTPVATTPADDDRNGGGGGGGSVGWFWMALPLGAALRRRSVGRRDRGAARRAIVQLDRVEGHVKGGMPERSAGAV